MTGCPPGVSKRAWTPLHLAYESISALGGLARMRIDFLLLDEVVCVVIWKHDGGADTLWYV